MMNKREIRDFDRRLKKLAVQEPFATPAGLAANMMRLTTALPDYRNRQRRKPKTILVRVLAAAALMLVLAAATTFAGPYVAQMAGGVIDYFNAPHAFKDLSKQAVYEQYNSKVGISTTDQGITLTVDNIAMDDNYILVFYTLHQDKPIKLLGESGDPEQWRFNWTAPYFWFNENGRYLEPPAQGEVEAYLEDACTLKGMQRFAVMKTLSDTVNLEIYTEEIFGKQGQWHIALSVDKSTVAAKSLTVTPNLQARVTTDWNRKYKHDITIEKVAVSPFGSQIVIGERGNNPFSQFALRDENGHYLTVIPAAVSGGSLFNFLLKFHNSFEFIGGSTGMRELTLIPIVSGADDDNLPPPKLQTVDIGTYPVRMPVSELGGFVLDSLDISTEKAVATLHQEGAVQIMSPTLWLLDENGQRLDFAAFEDTDYNRETGEITVTQYFRGVSQDDLTKIKKAGYFTRPQRLNEDEAVTVKLK
jgi:hypothetical protein